MIDDATTLALPRMISEAGDGLVRTGRRMWIDQVPPLRLVVAGPPGAGKTELVHALLGRRVPHAAPVSAPGRPTTKPVEFVASRHDGIALELAADHHVTAVPQVVPVRADLLDSPRTRRIIVSSGAHPLVDWSLRVVDTPGVDAPSGGMVALPPDVWAPATAVLYVVPSRGVTEVDVRALELLRSVPTVLVVNLLDTEIVTSRSAWEPMATPQLASAVGVAVAARRLAVPGPERAALCSVLALLRGLGTPAEALVRVRDHAWYARRELDDDYTGEFAALRGARRTGDRLQEWDVVTRLLHLERRGAEVVSLGPLLSTVSTAAARTADVDALRATVEDRARALVDGYNVEGALRRGGRVRAAVAAANPVPLDGVLSEHRAALREVVAAIADDVALLLTDGDRKVLRGVGDDVLRDRFEVAVVGQFSAGKSSLINALLGVPLDTPLLPTATKPETATINHVVWDDHVSVGVTWVPAAELTLLKPDPHLGLGDLAFRVHREELAALVGWIDEGIVDPRHCEFRLRSGAPCPPADGIALLERMAAALGVDEPDPPRFAYLRAPGHPVGGLPAARGDVRRPLLPDDDFPVTVTVHRFTGVPSVWRDDFDLPEAFAAVRDHPGLALRIEKLTIGYPHDLLRHITLVDTPGTDAPIPRHREATRAAVKDNRRRAVIYCFHAAKAGSTEDNENLAFLRTCRVGTDEVSRFFFVITMKGLHDPAKQSEIRTWVADRLTGQGITGARLFFTEVVAELNDEFHALARALGEFGASAKLPLLVGHARRVTEIVAQVRERDRRTLDGMAQDAAARERRRVVLRGEAAELTGIREEFVTSTAWGVADVRRRTRPSACPTVQDLDGDVERAVSRPAIEAVAKRLADDVEEIDAEVAALVHGTWAGCAGKLRSTVASRLPDRVVAPATMTIDEELFASSGLVETASTLVWRSGWRRLTDLVGADRRSWDHDLDQNHDRVASGWRRSKQGATARVERLLDGAEAATLDELDRLAAGIEQEYAAACRTPSREAAVETQASLTAAEVWLTRLHSLIRTIERAAS